METCNVYSNFIVAMAGWLIRSVDRKLYYYFFFAEDWKLYIKTASIINN